MGLELQIADYVLLGVGAFAVVIGLFRGFSGELGSVVGWVVGVAVGFYSWPELQLMITERWVAVLALIFAVLLTFGIVRWIVSKFAHLALAQPTDAILGAVVGLAKLGAIVFVLLHFQLGLEYSNILRELVQYVG